MPATTPPSADGQPLAQRLADYAYGLSYDDLDEAALERVKAHLIDSLGCAIAAFDERPVRICREIALSAGSSAATLIGTRQRTLPDLAAFANCAAIRYYDLNDVYVGRPSTHPSDNIAACLAVAEAERASARELITAIALAYEINCRLVDAFDLSDRGWDAPIFSLPAVALAAGKLMRLPSDKLAHAVALAINDHVPLGQTRSGALSDWKGLGDAEAGRNAVFAAKLARAGISGPAQIFEGRKGVFALVTGASHVDVGGFGKRGRPFRIVDCGLKTYPVFVYGQTTIVAGIEIARQVGDVGRIASIEIATGKRGFQQGGSEPEKWAPTTKDTADHSLPYIAARAIIDGGIDDDSFALDKLVEPAVVGLMSKISVKEDHAFSASKNNVPATRITAVLTDGRRVEHSVTQMSGFPGKPLSRASIEAKFRSNVRRLWDPSRADALLETVWALEQTDVATLMMRLAHA